MAAVPLTSPRMGFPALFLATLLLLPIGGVVGLLTHSSLAGLAAILFSWIAWNKPSWVLFVIIGLAPLMRSWNRTAVPPEIMAQAKVVGILILGLLWATRWAISNEKSKFPPWVIGFLMAWGALTALATIHAMDPWISLDYLTYTLAGVAAFCVTLHMEERTLRRTLALILSMGGLIGCLIILQYAIVVYHVAPFLERYLVEPRTELYAASHLLPGTIGQYRPSGTMFHPNTMGLYLALLIPFCCALFSVRNFHKSVRVGLALVASIMTLALIATGSRGAMVSMAMALLYLSIHRGYRWMLGLGGVVFALGLLVLAASPQRETWMETLVARARISYGLSGRPTIWRNTWAIIQENPFLGVGPGNLTRQYVSRFGYFTPNDLAEQQWQIWAIQTLGAKVIDNFHSHNIYLQLLAEAGMAGPLIFLIGIIGIVAHGERAGQRWRLHSFYRAMGLAVASNAMGMMVYGFFDSQLVFTIGSVNLIAGPLLAFGLRPQGIHGS